MHRVIFIAAMLFTTPAWGEFKPLSKAEPIVRMVLQEANNEPFAGMVVVAGVALDRIEDRRWPGTADQVVRQRNQFTGMSIALRDYSQQQITRSRLAVATAEVGERPCGRVLYYHATWMRPAWDYSKIEIACQIGGHIFYRDKERLK
jgi:spore germination cell wall hydrolase CwlJ-like protein